MLLPTVKPPVLLVELTISVLAVISFKAVLDRLKLAAPPTDTVWVLLAGSKVTVPEPELIVLVVVLTKESALAVMVMFWLLALVENAIAAL